MPNTSRRPRLRPHVYVHVEFGLSWGADQGPRNHEVTYRSRALRERMPPFPRQIPAPNTNYLTTANPPVSYDLEMYHGYYAPPLRQIEQTRHVPQPAGAAAVAVAEPRRPSRSESRSSHERGQSAPPPIGSNPWDVNVSRGQQGGYPTGSTHRDSRNPPQVWKPLPEAPSRFRLGEDGLPWGGWSVPYGYDPEAHPQDEDYIPSACSVDGPSGSNVVSATNPTEVSTFSPGPSPHTYRSEDPGRVHDLGALGAALMTVDNGFENQWWYQGQREAVRTGEAVGEAAEPPQRFSRNSLGWAVASPASNRYDRLSFATTDVMSPVPAYVSPESAQHPPLVRSLSTRSDELFFTERSRNPVPA